MSPDPRITNRPTPGGPAPASPKTAKVSNKTVFILLGAAGGLTFFCMLGLVLYAAISMTGKGTPTRSAAVIKAKQRTATEDEELKPDDLVAVFLTEIGKEQFEDAYKFRTSVGFQGQMSQAEFSQLVQKNRGLIRHISRRISKSTKQAGIYEYKIHVGGGPWGGADCTVEVSEENEGWRIRRFTVEG